MAPRDRSRLGRNEGSLAELQEERNLKKLFDFLLNIKYSVIILTLTQCVGETVTFLWKLTVDQSLNGNQNERIVTIIEHYTAHRGQVPLLRPVAQAPGELACSCLSTCRPTPCSPVSAHTPPATPFTDARKTNKPWEGVPLATTCALYTPEQRVQRSNLRNC